MSEIFARYCFNYFERVILFESTFLDELTIVIMFLSNCCNIKNMQSKCGIKGRSLLQQPRIKNKGLKLLK